MYCENAIPVVTRSVDAFGETTSILSDMYCSVITTQSTPYIIQDKNYNCFDLFFPPLFIKRPNAKIFHPNSQYSVLEKLQCCPMKVIIKVSLISIMFPVTGFISNILSG